MPATLARAVAIFARAKQAQKITDGSWASVNLHLFFPPKKSAFRLNNDTRGPSLLSPMGQAAALAHMAIGWTSWRARRASQASLAASHAKHGCIPNRHRLSSTQDPPEIITRAVRPAWKLRRERLVLRMTVGRHLLARFSSYSNKPTQEIVVCHRWSSYLMADVIDWTIFWKSPLNLAWDLALDRSNLTFPRLKRSLCHWAPFHTRSRLWWRCVRW